MRDNFFALYDSLCRDIRADKLITEALFAARWGFVRAGELTGIAMATPVESTAQMFPEGLAGLPLAEAAKAVKSWNFREASLALAAINACRNTPERAAALSACAAFERHYTEGIDFSGRTVALIGHMKGGPTMRQTARKVYIIERDPQPGDYPDSACDFILPQCDIVIISGSTIINKTLPHLLTLCRDAYTVLTGPSVPLCPELFDFGIDRISGMCVSDSAGLRDHVGQGRRGSPYPFGETFILSKR